MASKNTGSAIWLFLGIAQLYFATILHEHIVDWLEPIFGTGGAAFLVLAGFAWIKGQKADQVGAGGEYNRNERSSWAKDEAGLWHVSSINKRDNSTGLIFIIGLAVLFFGGKMLG